MKQLYGSEPEISWFDAPVIVDNQAGGAITKAGATCAPGTVDLVFEVMRVLARR